MPPPIKNTSSIAQAQAIWDVSRPIADIGGLFVSDTAEHTGDFLGILILTDAVVDFDKGSVTGSPTAVAAKAGVFIPVRTPRVKFASGTGIAYYATPVG